jgi:hypothetical protein
MLTNTIKDSLEVMGYSFDKDVVGQKETTLLDMVEEQPL